MVCWDTLRLFELAADVTEPVKMEIGLGEVNPPASGTSYQAGSGTDQMSNDRAEAVPIHRRGVVQVEINQWILQGILFAL